MDEFVPLNLGQFVPSTDIFHCGKISTLYFAHNVVILLYKVASFLPGHPASVV